AMTMSWKPYTATDASPQPVVGSTTYTAAYAVRPDPHYTSPARFEVERWYCENSTLLAHNVVAGNLATSDFSFTAPVVNTTKCPTGGQVVTVSLNHYQTDTAISAYSYQGCLNGRVR
ncbi:MAG: hypothetical protein QOD07_2632, partial [Frankiaceae bacterium]|nr:hypothetical protein [Frankiaceae bacterium]